MDRKLRVLLMQLPVPNNPATNVPLAGGYLKAYAHAQGLLHRVEIDLLPRAIADYAGDAMLVEEIVARAPDVLGISLYTWNSERNLDVARRVKECLPDLAVIVGGPEVQRDNDWVLAHSAVDVAVLGEGEQTFAELLALFADQRPTTNDQPNVFQPSLSRVPGIAFRDDFGLLHFTADRVALSDLAVVPSPYLLGYLDLDTDDMLMVEVSRWCPYSCSFCLYGRNAGTKLGNRYFGLERVLAEIRWGHERGIKRLHFVEANLNLVPLFWPLMRALEDLNSDQQMTFYAELRGEHLTDEVVLALDRANVRYVEVGLQTANPVALKASLRRTDLRKWAAGTRRLYERGIEVYLDVILGLPADDEAGIHETLDFIKREDLGTYDIFTLQVLPGTAVRQQAQQYGLQFQPRPPYYVLETGQLSFAHLQRLRRELKQGANIPPDTIEGMPEPRRHALVFRADQLAQDDAGMISQLWLLSPQPAPIDERVISRLAAHVDVVVAVDDLEAYKPLFAAAIKHNPAAIFDVYIVCDEAPMSAKTLRQWRATLPFQSGYLDKVAIYQADPAIHQHVRVSPRCLLVLPWTSTVEPGDFEGIAEVIWRFELAEGDAVPFNAWESAGGAGVWLHFATDCTASYRAQVLDAVTNWEQETGRRVWLAAVEHS